MRVLSVAAISAVAAGLGLAATRRSEIPDVSIVVKPPFKKVWTFQAKDHFQNHVLGRDAIYFASLDSYGAVDLATGRKLWERQERDQRDGYNVVLGDNALYVQTGTGKLKIVDPKTGADRWVGTTIKGTYPSPAAFAEGVLYGEFKKAEISALDTASKRTLWSTSLIPTGTRYFKDFAGLSEPPVTYGPNVLVATGEEELLCLNRRDGGIIWRYKLESESRATISGMIVSDGRLYCTTGSGGLLAINITTGKKLWSLDRTDEACYSAPVMLDGSLFYTVSEGSLYRVRASDGHLDWERSLVPTPGARPPRGHTDMIGASGPVIYGGQVIVSAGRSLLSFAPNGDKQWEWNSEEDLEGHPFYVLDDGILLAANGGVFARFVPGAPPGLPRSAAGRKELAIKLAARYEALSTDEKRTFVKLGDEAFEALADHCRDLMVRIHSQPGRKYKRYDDDPDYQLYSALNDLGGLMKPHHATTILQLIDFADSRKWKVDDQLLWMLAETNDRRALPRFLAALRQPAREPQASALKYVQNSSAPQAVSFMIEQLRNPKANPQIRNAAFCNLARTGGEAGLKAVLAARDHKLTIPSLAEEMQLSTLPKRPAPNVKKSKEHDYSRASKLLDVRTGQGGKTWGLVESRILGSLGDLWIVRWDGSYWADPIFTGATYTRGFVRSSEVRKQYGMTETEMLGGGWFTKVLQDPAIRRDSDGDGWSDLVEQRLETDPNKADSDGDGIPDSRDRNPLAARLPETDAEQIFAAAFESRFAFDNERDVVPCLVTVPEGMRPVVLGGWKWLIIHEIDPLRRRRSVLGVDPISYMYGQGAAHVSIYLTEEYKTESGRTKYRQGKLTDIPPTQTEVKVHLSCYYDGLAGSTYGIRLCKFGKTWVVIESSLESVS